MISPRTVAITGATGFVGSHLLRRHLAVGDRVRIFTRQDISSSDFAGPVTVFRGDLCEQSDVLRDFLDGVDVLYHCAAELRDISRMFATNIIGTRNLAEAAENNIGHWVQLSSVAIYGRQPDGLVYEGTNPNLHDRFATTESKLEAEKLVVNSAHVGGFTYAILRPCKIYGAGMPDDSLRNVVKYIGKGFFFFIGKKGAPANYVHVENVVEALFLCGVHEAARNHAFNICDAFTVEELVFAIARALGRPPPKLRVPKKVAMMWVRLAGRFFHNFPLTEDRVVGLTSRAIYCTEAIRGRLGYSPVVPLEDGILDMVYKSHAT